MSTFSSPKLPPKEAALFKKMTRTFDLKQWKLGLKLNRQLMSNPKLADHAEVVALKGLLMYGWGKREEAEELVKRGLMKDLQSPICWHVYGIMHRYKRKYEEAIKAYRNALKWDKSNLNIYRDLSLSLLQLKELDGFMDARYNILKLRPSQQSSWFGYSLAYLYSKDYPMALKVMAEYRKTMIPTKSPPEYNEIIFFEVHILIEAGDYEGALKHMAEADPHIVDVLCLAETKASIFMTLKRYSEAELIYRELLMRNPENFEYHQRLEECLGLKTDAAKLAHYKEMAVEFPRSHVIRKMPLLLTKGDAFRGFMDKFLRTALKKGVPSIYVSIKVHYKDPEKVKIIEDLVTGYVTALRKCEKLDVDSPGPPEPPSTRLWATVLLAQHHDALRNCSLALELINEALEHTATEIQLYMIKAKICRHGGDIFEAAKWMEEGRILDTADRFVNCKCVKYLLRINRIDRAIDVAGLFTREGPSTLDTMFEMQSMWFQTELGYAYHRIGELGEALKKYHEVDKHFGDIIDDHYEFHGYCMRRGTLRSYLQLAKAKDGLRSHRFYVEVAKKAIEIYLHLHDKPESKKGTMNGPTTNRDEVSSELKKKQRKERKAQHRAQAQSKGQEDKKEVKQQPKAADPDRPNPEAYRSEFVAKDLLQVENPLDAAIVFLKPLQSLSPNLITGHLLAYAIHSRRRKFLLMLQSIKRAQTVDSENGEVHSIIVDFTLAYEAEKSNLPSPVQEVIEASRQSLTHGKSLTDLNREFLERHEESLDHMIPASQVLFRLQPNSRDSAIKYITNLSSSTRGKTLENCTKVQKLLQASTFGPLDSSILKAYEEKCREFFPLATAFKLPPSSDEATPANSLPNTNVKEMVPKNITANEEGGVIVLKQTSLSLAAMSDLSGDINDTALPSAKDSTNAHKV